MTISDSRDIIPHFDLFFIDLWGVVWLGAECRPIPGAAGFIDILKNEGKEFYFLSNTVWPEEHLLNNLSEQGIEVDKNRIITAGRVVSDTIDSILTDSSTHTWYHAGRPWEPPAYFSDLNLVETPEDADALIVGDFRWREGETPPKQARDIETALSGGKCKLSIICNPDERTLQTDGEFAFQSGYFMKQMQKKFTSTGYEYIGKPYLPIYEYGLNRFPGIPLECTCMIGDNLDTDIAGAENAGIGKVLVCSGNTTAQQLNAEVDFVLSSLAPKIKR